MSQPVAAARWAPDESTPTRLILVRHGSTTHTADRRFSGRNDLPLSETGEREAAALAERFDGYDTVLSSPLRRARQTAAAIAALGPVRVVEDFTETDFGAWEGLTFAEASASWPDELSSWLGSPDIAPPGGESFAEVAERVSRARDEVLATFAGKTVVLVTHVTPIKTLLRLALDAPPISMFRLHLDAASVSVIDYYADGVPSVRSMNGTGHLR